MKKMLIALAATAVLGMGAAMASTSSYERGFSDAVEGNGNACKSFANSDRYDCNHGYVQGTKEMNNASGGN